MALQARLVMDQKSVMDAADSGEAREAARVVADVLREQHSGDGSSSSIAKSFEAEALRAEIISVGRKLWQRQYVDGNGGNISARLGSKYLLCTPTMMSKGDLQPADICLSDLAGNILAGNRMRTSEILLHLEIYKANPNARSVVHCHPPYATAFALTGSAPAHGYISEFEYFIGPVALAPYETPGTQAFAETVLPFVQNHNTILLANHGVVCWADTVTRAEWLVEILDTYCRTLLIAQQIGRPLQPIPPEKLDEILALKKQAGLPDARLGAPVKARTSGNRDEAELESLLQSVAARLEDRA